MIPPDCTCHRLGPDDSCAIHGMMGPDAPPGIDLDNLRALYRAEGRAEGYAACKAKVVVWLRRRGEAHATKARDMWKYHEKREAEERFERAEEATEAAAAIEADAHLEEP